MIILLIYIDDLLITCPDLNLINETKILSKLFEIKDLCPAKKLLGFEIEYDANKKYMKLYQSNFQSC